MERPTVGAGSYPKQEYGLLFTLSIRSEGIVGLCKDSPDFPSLVIDHVALVQDLVDRVLRKQPRPTAIFAPDGSVGAMAARGLQAGRDISLMACNNERPLLIGIYPALTMLDVHAHEIGALAVDQLAWRIAHPEYPSVDLAVEPTLVEGESVARLREQ